MIATMTNERPILFRSSYEALLMVSGLSEDVFVKGLIDRAHRYNCNVNRYLRDYPKSHTGQAYPRPNGFDQQRDWIQNAIEDGFVPAELGALLIGTRRHGDEEYPLIEEIRERFRAEAERNP